MHYVGLELLKSRRIQPPIPEPTGLATPSKDVAFLSSRTKLHRLAGEAPPEEVSLPGSFEPQLMVECPRQELLVVDSWGETLVLGLDGKTRRRLALGTDLADAAADDFGVFVLRKSGRLDKFDFEGRQLNDDPQVRKVNAASKAREGLLLLVPYDGSVWLNLEEHFDDEGEPGLQLDPVRFFGEGRVAGDLLGDDGIVVLTEDGRVLALNVRGEAREARLNREAVKLTLGRDLTARYDCLATRGDLLTVFSTDICSLTTFTIFAE